MSLVVGLLFAPGTGVVRPEVLSDWLMKLCFLAITGEVFLFDILRLTNPELLLIKVLLDLV